MSSPKTNMKYVRLGKSGLKVSSVILGCMSYGSSAWQGWVLDEEESLKHIKTAYDSGINTFDTANMYSNGLSEVVLGKAIKQLNLPRDEIVIMTKVWGPVGEGTTEPLWTTPGKELDALRLVNQRGLSRKHIFESIKHSLRRLQLEYVDVLQCHRIDPETPIEETMQALHDVVQAGYVRYIGMSSCYAWQFQKMQNYAIANKLTPFISMQNYHSAVYREEEREMIPMLQDMGVGCIPWSPLARGFLARPVGESSKRAQVDPGVKYMANSSHPPSITINERVEEIAKKRGISMAQVALAWTLSKDFITAPIIGTTSLKNLEDLLGGIQVQLTDEEIKYIDEPYQARPVVGHT